MIAVLRALLAVAALACAAMPARADEIAWPLPACMDAQIAVSSPAPFLTNSQSLSEVPFFIAFHPITAGYLVSLDDAGQPTIRCAVPLSDWRMVNPGAVAVAGLDFSAPRTPNPAGLYLVRLAVNFGIGTVRPPPKTPVLPPCQVNFGIPGPIVGPKPLNRVNPKYPDDALQEEIEGGVNIVLDVYASGAATPRCMNGSWPVGWFEDSALQAVSQWRFAPPENGLGQNRYSVTVRFKLE